MSSVKFHLSILSILIPVIDLCYQKNLCTSSGTFWCPADEGETWTYRGRKGPMFWGSLKEEYETCYSDKQSPIVIDKARVEMDGNLAKLELKNYGEPLQHATILNNGHTIQVVPKDGVVRTVTINYKTYSLRQFHFHWGCNDTSGSEHAVDGKYYAMELNFVHVSDDNEIAVVSVFFEQKQDTKNSELEKIVSQLSNVMYKDTEVKLSSNLNLNNLVPQNPTSYYRYEGSLTTPPCSEVVKWSVLTNPIPVGRSQMNEFRSLFSSTKNNASQGCKLAGNYRPVQPLNGREIHLSE